MNELLAECIQELRLQRGLTQEEVARRLDCSRQRYARLEKGEIEITYRELKVISEVFEVEVREITDSIEPALISSSLFRIPSDSPMEKPVRLIKEILDQFYAQGDLFRRSQRREID